MEQRERTQISADKILQELLLIARSDISLAFRKDGTLKPIHEIPEEVRRAISGVETLETLVGKKLCKTNKVKFWDKVAALGLLGKNLKLFTDQVNVTGTIKTIRVKSNVDVGGDGE
jgi:phage terminase small subunit